MFKLPVWGVLVENAEPNIKNWLIKKDRRLKYQSNLKYANAVIEALEKFRI